MDVNSFIIWRELRLSTFASRGLFRLLFDSPLLDRCCIQRDEQTETRVKYTIEALSIWCYVLSKYKPSHNVSFFEKWMTQIFEWSVKQRNYLTMTVSSFYLPFDAVNEKVTEMSLQHSRSCRPKCPYNECNLFIMGTRNLFACEKDWIYNDEAITVYEYNVIIRTFSDVASFAKNGVLREIQRFDLANNKTAKRNANIGREMVGTLLRYFTANVKTALRSHYGICTDI